METGISSRTFLLIGVGASLVGLFSNVASTAVLTGIALRDVSVTGGEGSAPLVGINFGAVRASYATGTVNSLDDYAAGLVGVNYGSVTASYSTAAVTGGDKSAGFVGNNMGSITNSYSTGAVGVAGASTGHAGFVGENTGGSITASYWDTQTSGQTASPGGGTGKTTLELQTPVEYGTTGIYRTWDADDIDGDTIADAPWDFGTNSEYPLLIFAGHSLQTQYPENLTAEYVLAAPGSGQVTLAWSIRSIVGVTGWEFDYKTYFYRQLGWLG